MRSRTPRAWGRWAAKVLKPKTRKLSGDDPVGERGFFEVADAVDAEGDPVAGEGHVAGGVGVGAVGVVEQRRGEERGEEEDEPEAAEEEQGARSVRRSAGVGRGRASSGCFEEGLVDHELVRAALSA